jgi:hypothetical protein
MFDSHSELRDICKEPPRSMLIGRSAAANADTASPRLDDLEDTASKIRRRSNRGIVKRRGFGVYRGPFRALR